MVDLHSTTSQYFFPPVTQAQNQNLPCVQADKIVMSSLGINSAGVMSEHRLVQPQRPQLLDCQAPARHAAPEDWGALEFLPLDEGRYPAYATVRRAAAAGGNRGAILNAADEVAVAAFLAGGLPFARIGETIADAVDRWGTDEEPALDGILGLDAEVRSALTAQLGTGVA